VHIETIAARSALHDWAIARTAIREPAPIVGDRPRRIDLRLDDHRDVLRDPPSWWCPGNGARVRLPGKHRRPAWSPSPRAGARPRLRRRGPGPGAAGAACVHGASRADSMPRISPRSGPSCLREFGRSAFGRDAAMRGLLGALLANVLRVVRPGPVIPGRRSGTANSWRNFGSPCERRPPAWRHRGGLRSRARSVAVAAASGLPGGGGTDADCAGASRRLVEGRAAAAYTPMTVAQVAPTISASKIRRTSPAFHPRHRQGPRASRAGCILRNLGFRKIYIPPAVALSVCDAIPTAKGFPDARFCHCQLPANRFGAVAETIPAARSSIRTPVSTPWRRISQARTPSFTPRRCSQSESDRRLRRRGAPSS